MGPDRDRDGSPAEGARGSVGQDRGREDLGPAARVLLLALLALVLAGLAAAVLSLSPPAAGLAGPVDERIGETGVSHPVTAVLLDIRGYDTLLELAVLLLALVGIWSTGPSPGCGAGMPGPLLRHLPRLLASLLVLAAGYLVWAGAHGPGGAFQAGALLGALGILLCLAGRRLPDGLRGLKLRLLAVLGVGVFAGLGVGVALLPGGAPLDWPAAAAKSLITGIELAAMLSIGVILAGLFAGGRP